MIDKKTILMVCGLVGAVFFVYFNHFENSFHFDDSHTIVDNPYIRDLHNLPRFFTDAGTFSVLPSNRTYRPLVTASLAVDYRLGQGLHPISFHISTFFWFLVQLILMTVLFRKIADLARPDPRNRWLALFAAALFAVHPAVAETVNYIIQRGDVYSTLGVIAAILMYVSAPQLRKYGFYLIPVVLAILSKPPALVFPAILFVYIRLFEEKRTSRAIGRCVPSLVAIAALACGISAMTPPTYTSGGGSAYAYRITQPLVAFRYFRTFFIPNDLSADSDRVALGSILNPGGWIGFAFVIALIGLALWCSTRREWRPAAFGCWWFLLALVPTSVFPLAEVENDHRMYFPFVGLVLAVSWAFALWLYRRPALGRNMTIATAVLSVGVLSAYGWGTRQRNEVWRTEETLWHDVTLKSPQNGRGLMNYGLTQMSKGEFRTALAYFERAAVFTPNYSVLEINRGIAYGASNQDTEAEQHFLRAIELASGSAEARYFYARWLKQKNRLPEAVEQLQTAIAANPDYTQPRYLLMEIYYAQADWAQLLNAAESMLQRFPSDTTAGNFRSQATSPDRPLSTQAKTAEDYLNLSLSFHRAGKFEECVAAAKEALKLRPGYAEAYNNMAAAYEDLHMWDAAIEAASQALKIEPDFQMARNNLLWSQDQKKKETGGKRR